MVYIIYKSNQRKEKGIKVLKYQKPVTFFDHSTFLRPSVGDFNMFKQVKLYQRRKGKFINFHRAPDSFGLC